MSNAEVLVMDSRVVEILECATLDDPWFKDFPTPFGANIHRVELGKAIYLISHDADENSALFVCNIRSNGGIGKAHHPGVAFSRALRMALSSNGNKIVGIPRNYKMYKKGNLKSIYAYHHAIGDGSRLCFRTTDRNLFLYAVTDEVIDLDKIDIPEELYRTALDLFDDALLDVLESKDTHAHDTGNFGIVLNDLVGRIYSQAGLTIEDWCNTKLTSQQRQFVDSPLNKPIRLRGSAGTGKTQCMAIKCIKEIFKAEEEDRPIRIAFITHSSGVAHEVVEGMMHALDPKNRRYSGTSRSHLWVGSLYELAKEKLSYESKDIVPLSLDGVAGRKEQEDLLEDCVKECINNPDFKVTLSNCSDYIRYGLTTYPMDSRFLKELSNEIACSLDSEGVKKSNREKVSEYLKGNRHVWQMNLECTEDRQIILDIHEQYEELLLGTDMINLDQMVADLYSYLNSHEWSIYKRNQGFDIVFIDELHYFNRYERLIFHLLVRESVHNEGQIPLFMAYDMKQGTDDRSLSSPGGIGRFFQTLHAGKSDLVDLTQVFRSTPQIARLLEHIDGAFPALDLEGEWQTYAGTGAQQERTSAQQEKDIPKLNLYSNITSMLDGVIKEAHRFAKQEGGKNVAVLCMSDSHFMRYINAGRIRNSISVIESNTDLTPIKNARQRCIFSMPENVAGLQFDRIYVINVDKQELDDADMSFGARRQILSRLYLAVSRASRHLTLAASEDCGGYSEVLESALQVDALRRFRYK